LAFFAVVNTKAVSFYAIVFVFSRLMNAPDFVAIEKSRNFQYIDKYSNKKAFSAALR